MPFWSLFIVLNNSERTYLCIIFLDISIREEDNLYFQCSNEHCLLITATVDILLYLPRMMFLKWTFRFSFSWHWFPNFLIIMPTQVMFTLSHFWSFSFFFFCYRMFFSVQTIGPAQLLLCRLIWVYLDSLIDSQ